MLVGDMSYKNGLSKDLGPVALTEIEITKAIDRRIQTESDIFPSTPESSSRPTDVSTCNQVKKSNIEAASKSNEGMT